MRYRLRTLLIVLAVGPPLGASGWLVAKPVVTSFLAPKQPEDDWTWSSPGVIREYSTQCDFGSGQSDDGSDGEAR
jgi:hypothetical protein